MPVATIWCGNRFPIFLLLYFFSCWASIEFILLEASWCCFVWVIQREEGFYGLYFTFSCTSLFFSFFLPYSIFLIESHALLRKFLICFQRDSCFCSNLQHVLNFHLCNTCRHVSHIIQGLCIFFSAYFCHET